MISIEQLKRKFPLVHFEKVDEVVIPRNEDACYPGGLPRPNRVNGDFVRIQNPMGGADVVRASDVKEIYRLAAWHQARAEASGFGA